MLVDLHGKVLSSTFEEHDVMTLKPSWAEQWPDIWFNGVCKTIRSAIEGSRINRAEVAGLCISGLYGGSGVACDKEMRPLRPRLIWMDRRSG